MNRKRKYLYLIKRCPRPTYHRAPYHPVILCDLKRVAMWEAGDTGSRAWLWSTENDDGFFLGWLLMRWEGLDIDYGGLVKGFTLPDGTLTGFWHYHNDHLPYIPGFRGLFPGAVWWSDREMPAWFRDLGVIYPPDSFSRQHILDTIADDGCQGFGNREEPSFWPPAIPDDQAGYLP